MKKYKGQTKNDCIAACVRTLINDENVPHCFNNIQEEKDIIKAWEDLRAFLASKNLFLTLFSSEDPWEEMSMNNPDIPYMLLCETASHTNHAVVCKNDCIIHDPSPLKQEIIGPHTLFNTWIIGVIGCLPKGYDE